MSLSLNYPTVRPTLLLDFINTDQIDPRITFSRASSATYFNSNGILTTAATNALRRDYNPSTLAPQGFLVEEARTNLMPQSQFVSGWTASAGTLTTNVTASPDGTTNAASFIEDSTNAARNINQSSQSFTAGATLTASLFVKQTGGATRHFRIQISTNTGTNGFRAYFNLATNSVALQTAGFGTGTAVANSATITPVGNGWYRISASGTVDPAATTASGMGFMQDTPSGSATYTGDGTSGLYIWGAQLEAGAFPTSYIPTTTTALTRSADVASVNTLSPWFNSASGTFYTEVLFGSSAATNTGVISAYESSAFANNRISIRVGNTIITSAGVQVANFFPTGTANTVAKYATAYQLNDFAQSVNGGAPATDTSGAVPANINEIELGGVEGTTSFALNGYLRRLSYYPVRLSNAQLQTITSA